MLIKKGFLFYTLLIGSTLGPLAIAQSQSDMPVKHSNLVSNLKKECKSDIEKHCKDVTPGEGRLAACLDSKEDQLSSECRAAWSGTKSQVSQRLDKAQVAFRNSCGSDVKKYCSKVPAGRGRLLECLDNHKNELSSSCQKFYSSLEDRLSKLVG